MSISELNIVWWNACNFYHYDSSRAKLKTPDSTSRWPRTLAEYAEKCKRVDLALKELASILGPTDILCLGEITRKAATDLKDRLFATHRLISLDVKLDEPTLQVAVLYPADSGAVSFKEQLPITVPATPRGTRPMAVLDISSQNHVIRLISCHWQSRMDEISSAQTRNRVADHLGMYSFDFIEQNRESHHVILVGDFNEEPFEPSLTTLFAHRHRGRALGRRHWADEDYKRMHLYNTSWRLMGEKHPYPRVSTSSFLDSAGTYYWEAHKVWRNFDQIIISGGLLAAEAPNIDESTIHIISSPAFLSDGFPTRFRNQKGTYVGVSDHLPVTARLSLT